MEVNTNELPKNSEEWAAIDGCKNYQVSWWGRVRNAKTGRILKACVSSNTYLTLNLSKMGKAKSFSVHVLVAREWVENPDNKRCVDHIDGNKTNNHYENLRWATHSENGRNQKNQTNTSSVYKGVYLHKPTKKWMAYIRINKKLKNLGYHASEREAGMAYNMAAVKYFKNFAKINIFED